jgi:hypothetical protein
LKTKAITLWYVKDSRFGATESAAAGLSRGRIPQNAIKTAPKSRQSKKSMPSQAIAQNQRFYSFAFFSGERMGTQGTENANLAAHNLG